MDGVTFADRFYRQVFPVAVILCTAMGALVYAHGSAALALDCFLAVFFGIRLDNHIELRRAAEAERQAQEGWERLRAPVHAS